MEIININDKLHDITNRYPDVIGVMVDLGFKDIVKPGMLQSVGRFMTIKKGAELKDIDIRIIKRLFYENGFLLEEM
jgi:hypothetical protein